MRDEFVGLSAHANAVTLGIVPPDPILRVQPSLDVTWSADTEEVEARRIAASVMPDADGTHPDTSGLGTAAKPSPINSLSGRIPAPPSVGATIAMPGRPIAPGVRKSFERAFGRDFTAVRVHDDLAALRSAREMRAEAYTAGHHIVIGGGDNTAGSATGDRLLAHELTHVVQQGAAPTIEHRGAAGSAAPTGAVHMPTRVARQERTIDVELIASLDEFQAPGANDRYRVGDAASSRVLMDIQDRSGTVVFRVFNFETSEAQEMTPALWSYLRGAAIIGGRNAGITRLGTQLTPSEWRRMWPDPTPEIFRRVEAGTLVIDDQALLTGYRGLIRAEASSSLDRNEKAIDELLGAPDRVARIQEFADGLREASIVRDSLERQRDELSHRLAAQHSFTFGPPKRGTGPGIVQQLEISRQRHEVQQTLDFWIGAFPLLTRLRTDEINAQTVSAKLTEIKANIVSARGLLDRGKLDPMTLDAVRQRVGEGLGPRAKAVVDAEDRSRRRWAMFGAVATLAATVAIMLLPGGIFINAAIGIAIAANAIQNAIEVGRLANTGMHVDEGLVSQSQTNWARFGAVLATVFAVLGAAAAGFRILRIGLALRGLGQSMPELSIGERAAVARAIADDPTLLRAFVRLAPGDLATISRVTAAVRAAGRDPRALRAALGDIARIAAIPRRVPTSPDLYEPFRRVTDGSDVARVAASTGLTRAEVEAAKRNLMLDEHILVDNAGKLYRGRFDPFDEVASVWGRAARGERLSQADRAFLNKLVKHEAAEGAILTSQMQTLEQAFLRGQLEGTLRTFLQRAGWSERRIADLLAAEPRPMTPYRYAHIYAHVSGAPNP